MFIVISVHLCDIEGMSPCVNGGICVPNGDSYLCACPAGYSGDNCEITRKKLVFVSCFLFLQFFVM